MKKSVLLIGGMLTLALALNTFAQTNVYSKNAVGYIQKSVLGGVFYLVSCPLVVNTTGPVLPSDVFGDTVFADGTSIYAFNPATSTYASEVYIDGLGWIPGSTDLSRTKGFWFTSPAATNLNFVGEVPNAASTATNLQTGFQLIAYPYPASTPVTNTALHSLAVDGDSVYKWDASSSTYISYAYIDGVGWVPSTPTLEPGDGFWFQRLGSTTGWTETKPYSFP